MTTKPVPNMQLFASVLAHLKRTCRDTDERLTTVALFVASDPELAHLDPVGRLVLADATREFLPATAFGAKPLTAADLAKMSPSAKAAEAVRRERELSARYDPDTLRPRTPAGTVRTPAEVNPEAFGARDEQGRFVPAPRAAYVAPPAAAVAKMTPAQKAEHAIALESELVARLAASGRDLG